MKIFATQVPSVSKNKSIAVITARERSSMKRDAFKIAATEAAIDRADELIPQVRGEPARHAGKQVTRRGPSSLGCLK